MAGNQAVVEFLLKWSESGGNLPEKVKRDLDRMGQSSTQATSLTDKLGVAFTRLERREPTNAIRQLKGAVDGLALSALGAAGPLGRLGSAFAGLGVGGPIGLLAIGGLATIAAGFKAVLDQANGLNEALRKVNDEFANMVGGRAAQFAKLGALRAREEQLQRPGAGEGILTVLSVGGEPIAKTAASNLRTARLAELRTVQAEIVELERQTQESRTQIIQRASDERRRRETDEDKRALREEAQRWEDHIRAIQNSAARVLPLAAKGRLPLTLRGKVEFAQRTNTVYAQEPEAPRPTDTGAIFSALLGLVGSAQGGAGGALSGLGGLASVALKSTPILGQVLSFGGGLLSLFSSGQAKVSISRLEQEALEQMRQVQQIPQYLSQNIVTNDLRGAKNRLARLEQLDTVTRGVT